MTQGLVGGQLARLLDAGRFVVTGEVVPPRSADPRIVTDQAVALVGYVDAVNVTDNVVDSPHMSPLAGVRFVADAGIEPTVQLVCRDRDRLALVADLYGAWALGARNALITAGDPLQGGDHPDAMAKLDLAPDELVALTRRMREEASDDLPEQPRFLIGVSDAPLAEGYDPGKLESRLDAGADFVMTQIAYDVEALSTWADEMRRRGVLERAKLLIGLVPLRSAEQARFIDERMFGVRVPPSIVSALADAGDGARELGVEITVGIVRELRKLEGVSGLHLVGMGREDLVRVVVHEAGLFPRPAA